MESLLAVPPEVLKLAGHPIRWNVLTRLARSDYRVQELVAFLQLPQNLVSYHLRLLRRGRLVTERKSSADERSVYYSLDTEAFRSLYLQAGEQLHPALAEIASGLVNQKERPRRSRAPLRVLFLCTGNSARSQMAEALLRQLSNGTIEVSSAGNQPTECVHPLALRVMGRAGIDINQARPKHLDEFIGQRFNVIVTVCDRVREICPAFPDEPEHMHWSLPDPAQLEGSEDIQFQAFEQTLAQLTTRIRLLCLLLEQR